MIKKFKSYVKRIIKLVSLEEMRILPGHLAFNIVLMIVPIFSLIGVLSTKINLNRVLIDLSNNVPDAVINIINSALRLDGNNYNLFLFIVFSFWMVSGGCRAIISASDLLFKINNQSNLKIILKSFTLVIILFLLIAFIIIVPILGDYIVRFFNEYLKLSSFNSIYHLFKYPISIILMFLLIKILYTLAPSIPIKSKYMNTGAWFTTISWFLVSRIYSYHLNNFSKYSLYYGSLSNILILLVWVYILAYLFTIGLSLNADNYLTSIKKEK